MNKVRTAVIGVGQLGQYHARWYKNIEESELVGVYDTDSNKCTEIAQKYDVSSFEKLSDLFGKVDAVSIATPTIYHHEVARELINEKIACLIEKPIASTVEQAEELVSIAKDKSVTLTVGHIERFNPAVRALKSFKINPRFIEAHRLAAFDPRGTDVAVILDLMIHDIDLSLFLTKSKVKKIDASAVSVISDSADIANARLTFENGAVANLTASRISLRAMRKLRLFQKSGYYSLDLAEKRADIYRLADDSRSDETGMRIPLGKSGREILYSKSGNKDDDMLCAELTSFVKAVQNGDQPEVEASEAVEALKIALTIEKIGLASGAGGVEG